MDEKAKAILRTLKGCDAGGMTAEAISEKLTKTMGISINLAGTRALLRIHVERQRVEERRRNESWPSEAPPGVDDRNTSLNATRYYRLTETGRRTLKG